MTDIKEAENAAFWLPPHFLTEEKPSNDPKMNQKYSGFGSDPFDSPDNDENINQNDDVLLLSHLTRHFSHISLHNNKSTTPEKPWLYSTSPQSALSGFGSTEPSPPLTPELKNDAAWELLYEAAGQVARLKINAMAAQMNNNYNNRALVGAPRHTSAFTPNHHCHCGYHHAWTPLSSQLHHHHHHRNQHNVSMYQGISTGVVGPTMEGVKRRSTGTGVFLPRRISTSPPPPPRNYQQRPQPLRSKPTEIMWARKNVMLEQQRRTENTNVAMVGQGHELSLPNDWTY
ncbi:uncharacterized protein LOC141612415 [Silene latifolia]|uniref:uncharacterized protein LOC141612415 n=1 Tax=Silene latifolia TaxID=37657 RepID=UPI003D77ADD9